MKYFNYICILVSIILFNIGINILKKTYIENFDNSKQKIWIISFGGGDKNYHDAVFRIQKEFEDINFDFYKIIAYTDKDLKDDLEFWKKNGNFIENNKRGYGYWIWKPYLILKTLNQMDNNDILFYLDSGCEIINNEKINERINFIIEKCNKFNILYTNTPQYEKTYNKMDLLEYMNLNNNEILNSLQMQASCIFMKKNDIIVEFINEWYNISCNYHFIDDSVSVKENDISFIENRHDQSVFSLLLKTEKYKNILNTDNNILYESDIYPISISRKRSG